MTRLSRSSRPLREPWPCVCDSCLAPTGTAGWRLDLVPQATRDCGPGATPPIPQKRSQSQSRCRETPVSVPGIRQRPCVWLWALTSTASSRPKGTGSRGRGSRLWPQSSSLMLCDLRKTDLRGSYNKHHTPGGREWIPTGAQRTEAASRSRKSEIDDNPRARHCRPTPARGHKAKAGRSRP